MTPTEFSASLSSSDGVRACQGTDVHELFSLVNDPRNPYDRLLTVDRLGNVVGGRRVTYVNVDMDVCLPLIHSKNFETYNSLSDDENCGDRDAPRRYPCFFW